MPDNRPRSREKHVTNNSKGVYKRGSGLGTGPVGGGSHGGGGRSGGSRSPLGIIIAILVVLLGGGGGMGALMSGGSSQPSQSYPQSNSGYTQNISGSSGQTTSQGGNASALYQALTAGNTSSGWGSGSNVGKLNTRVAEGSRKKYTSIKGNGKDTTTIMVYMCGTDLESRSGMATNDLKEMLNASVGEKINLIIYTGGCAQWKNNVISSSVNQIYQISQGKMRLLEKDMGSKPMTDPDTLVQFIKYCKKNFPADRNDLIFWDHGGGSVSGYGYDEKYRNAGSMTLAGIDQALSKASMKFDFIGFDACLMATAENALMLDSYADYMIASEETEPGVGWYYTDWLTAYTNDPSMSTLEIGRNIIDGFVNECNRSCRGQQTTLSIIDLAEFANTVPEKLKAFARDTTQMMKDQEYQTIATARNSSREFAQSSKIDQVDLVDLAKKIGSREAEELAEVLVESVKYNRTSSNMTNAYGVSIYFPNRKLSKVDSTVRLYEAIGMDDEYAKCIQNYASMEASGQTAAYSSGYTGNPLGSLLGTMGGSSSSYGNADLTSQLLQSLLTAGINSMAGGSGASTLDFLAGRSITDEEAVQFVADNQFDASALTWTEKGGRQVISLSEDQWAKVTELELNMFYDDGEGYIDLGLDNLFEFTEDEDLVGSTDRTWLAINGQPVAYYHTTTVDDGDEYSIQGYVPCMVNGERAKLLLEFSKEEPYGVILGTLTDYHDGETETIAKADGQLQEGDQLEFLCDYYTYEGEYQDTYYLGDPMTVTADMEISNVDVGEGDVRVTYRFTDIYGMEYWSEVMP